MSLRFCDIQAQYVPEVSLLRIQFYQPPASLSSFKTSMKAIARITNQDVAAEGLIDWHGLPSMSLESQFWTATS